MKNLDKNNYNLTILQIMKGNLNGENSKFGRDMFRLFGVAKNTLEGLIYGSLDSTFQFPIFGALNLAINIPKEVCRFNLNKKTEGSFREYIQHYFLPKYFSHYSLYLISNPNLFEQIERLIIRNGINYC